MQRHEYIDSKVKGTKKRTQKIYCPFLLVFYAYNFCFVLFFLCQKSIVHVRLGVGIAKGLIYTMGKRNKGIFNTSVKLR